MSIIKEYELAKKIDKSIEEVIDLNCETLDNLNHFCDEISNFADSDEHVKNFDDTMKNSFKTTILEAIERVKERHGI